jgi:hypothetical protein
VIINFPVLYSHNYATQLSVRQINDWMIALVLWVWRKWGGRLRQPFHRDHFLIYYAFPIFSIPPVVLHLLWSTVSCTMESYHGCLVPWYVYLIDEILIQLNAHTHIGHPGTTLSCPSFLGFLVVLLDNLVPSRWSLPTLDATSFKSSASIGLLELIAPWGSMPELLAPSTGLLELLPPCSCVPELIAPNTYLY